MDIFRKALTVRLRSHHDKYLLANQDEKSVSQERDASSQRALWRVELVDGTNLIRLKSCYGKYLTASDAWLYLGMIGKNVIQTFAMKPDSSTEWEPIREGVQVRLKSRYGYYLRANSGWWPWRNSITHNIPRRSVTQDWILWEVDVVEHKEDPQLAESIIIRRSSPFGRSSCYSSDSELYLSAHPSPEMSPNVYPKKSQENLPNISPRISPKLSPIMSPRSFPNVLSEMSSDMYPKISQESLPNIIPRISPMHSPLSYEASSDMFIDLSPNLSSRMSHIRSPKLPTGVSVRQQRTEGLNRNRVPVKSEGRLIWYKVAGNSFAEIDETMPAGNSFNFRGSEVEELKDKLAKETGLDDEEFIVCSRNPFSGRLYPLKLDLPPNHSPMSLFIVPSSSEVAREIASLSPELR